ncbi:MAG: trypsin-like peptidase domain-containing protein [Flavobacteriaceae bacterium]
MKRFSSLFLVALLSGGITLGAYKLFIEKPTASSQQSGITTVSTLPTTFRNVGFTTEAPDFTEAAELALHSVVHVKNVSYRQVNDPIMEFFYGYRGGQQQAQIGTGSGVIISEDGYIVTNNHVINNASEIEITLNNKKAYPAKLIGTDSQMDIALLKIDTNDKLPYTVFGDSDNVRVGEWVLAVGNPYNLNSTVTAGIISAKARNVGNRVQNNIQSFIQTDAVVNPGNSGGALVNTRGELIGINTMISSTTGSYVGYSFAVPSNITRKIIEDIMEFGNVQRGVLGVKGGELNQAVAKELGLNRTQGFYVADVTKESGAEKAGLKKGDVIIKIDNQQINSFAELTGYISTKRPNDVVTVYLIRDGKEIKTFVKLTKYELLTTEFFGMEVEDLPAKDKKKLGVDYGVRIKESEDFEDVKGKIILSVNGVKVRNTQDLNEIVSRTKSNTPTRIELLNQNGEIERYIIR